MDDQNILTINDFRGGLSPEANRGPRGSFRYGQCLDIRGGDNTLKCNQALKKDSGSVVVDLILNGFVASDGNQYAFGDAGNIYRKSGGTWTKVFTDADGKITGAAEFTHNDGSGNYVPYLVYATGTHVKEIALSTAGSGTWSSTTTVGSFTNNVEPHTMRVETGNLLIADGNWTAMLDYQAAYNNQAWELPAGNNGRCMAGRDGEVILGTEGTANPEGWLWTWDGSADSWIIKRPAQGETVNALIPLEGGMMLQTGTEGNLRYFNYADVSPLMRVLNTASCYPGGVCQYRTIPHIAMNGGTANGVYSVGRLNKNDVIALNLEYIPSHGQLTGADIGAIWADGSDLYVGWKYGSTYGIDVIDQSNKASAIYESLEIDAKKPYADKLMNLIKIVAKQALPTGCSVAVKYKSVNDTTWQDTDSEDGATTMSETELKRLFNSECQGETFQIRLELTPNGNDTPEITAMFAFFNELNND